MIYHTVKFGDHRHSGRGDIIVFVCNVILQDPVIQALNDFMVRTPLGYFTIIRSLLAMGTLVVEM